MKFLMSWVTDPCVHLVVVVLLLIHFSMSSRSVPDSAKERDEATVCRSCSYIHDPNAPCSTFPSERGIPFMSTR